MMFEKTNKQTLVIAGMNKQSWEFLLCGFDPR
jgi:hypothetical protein